MTNPKVVLDEDDVRRTLVRIAHEIVEKTGGSRLAVVGIHRRGALLAQRVRDLVAELVGEPVPLGDIDISFYRDDVATRNQPTVHASHIEFPVDGMTVVLVDDVLFSGRTIRAALDALSDIGRPRAVRLAALVDRGHRELPIRADFVGKNLPSSLSERINVRLVETDGEDLVAIESAPDGGTR